MGSVPHPEKASVQAIPLKNLPKQKIVRICPACGSDKVSMYILPFPNGATRTGKLECAECGKVFPEDKAEFVLMQLMGVKE